MTEYSRLLQVPVGNLCAQPAARAAEAGPWESAFGSPAWYGFATDLQFARALHRANYLLWPHLSAGLGDAPEGNERPDFGFSASLDQRCASDFLWSYRWSCYFSAHLSCSPRVTSRNSKLDAKFQNTFVLACCTVLQYLNFFSTFIGSS